MARASTAAAVAAVLLLGGACGSDSGDDAMPEGNDAPSDPEPTRSDDGEEASDVQSLTTTAARVEVPSTWEVVEDEDTLVRARSDAEPSRGVVTLQVADGELSDVRQLAVAVKSEDQLTLTDYEEGGWEPIEVDGADEALQEEISWTATIDGEEVARRGLNVYLRAGSTGVVLGVLADDDAFDPSWVESIVASAVVVAP